MTDAASSPSDDQPVPETPPAAQRASRRRRAASLTGQAVGVIGIVVSLALVAAVLLGRGWLVGQVDETTGAIDAALARTVVLVDDAGATVGDVAGRVAEVGAAADAVAVDPAATPEAVQQLLSRVNALSERYLSLQAAYQGLREDAVSALDRLQLLDRLLPGLSVPEGPVDALAALDERAQSLDAGVMQLITAGAAVGAANDAARAIADRSRAIEAGLGSVQDALGAVRERVEGLRTSIADFADRLSALITIGALVIMLLLLYIAFLHLVLFRAGRGFGQAPAD